jgi:hypothetical protein
VKDCGRDIFYAIPAWAGPFDITAFENKKYRFSYASHDINELKAYLNPQLLFQNFYEYNFISCAGEYFALKIGEVGFSLEKIHKGKYNSPCFTNKNLKRLKERIFFEKVKRNVKERVKVVVKKIIPG